MIERARITAAIETYCRVQTEKDAAGWASLYADDVFYEDPVGIRQVRGKAEVVGRIWDDIVRNAVSIWPTDEIVICGAEALAIMACDIGPLDRRHRIAPVVDHFRFNDAGLIVSVRGFYNLT